MAEPDFSALVKEAAFADELAASDLGIDNLNKLSPFFYTQRAARPGHCQCLHFV